jgi:hypothetical protein
LLLARLRQLLLLPAPPSHLLLLLLLMVVLLRPALLPGKLQQAVEAATAGRVVVKAGVFLRGLYNNCWLSLNS